MATIFLLRSPLHQCPQLAAKVQTWGQTLVCSLCGKTCGHDVRGGSRPDEHILIYLWNHMPRHPQEPPPPPRHTTRSPAGLGPNKYSFSTFATTMASAYPHKRHVGLVSDCQVSGVVDRCLDTVYHLDRTFTVAVAFQSSHHVGTLAELSLHRRTSRNQPLG